jgi:hypothetical protein
MPHKMKVVVQCVRVCAVLQQDTTNCGIVREYGEVQTGDGGKSKVGPILERGIHLGFESQQMLHHAALSHADGGHQGRVDSLAFHFSKQHIQHWHLHWHYVLWAGVD